MFWQIFWPGGKDKHHVTFRLEAKRWVERPPFSTLAPPASADEILF
jgi:hypothetical protein